MTRPIDLSGQRAESLARLCACALLDGYHRVVSPLIIAAVGPACRFEPSCSLYARDAISHHGLGRGGLMAARRLLRCRPGGGAGYDPVAPPAGADGNRKIRS
jgi:hypothetical protein